MFIVLRGTTFKQRNTLLIKLLLYKQVVLFISKLKEILDECPECRNKYELVPFSGERDTIANVLEQKIRREVDMAIWAEADAKCV